MKRQNILGICCSIWLALIVGPSERAIAQVVISNCGESFAGSARLGADLDCTNVPDGVIIVRGTLELAGHSISNATASGVRCEGICKIIGPGTISGNGIGVMSVTDIKIESATISGNAAEGVLVDPVSGCTVCPYDRKSLQMSGSTVSGNGADGIKAFRGDVKRMKDSTVSENAGNGIVANFGANLLRVDLLDNGGHGLDALHGRCKDCQVLRNALNGINFYPSDWVLARKLVKTSVVSENGMNGVAAADRVLKTAANDNQLAGVESGSGRVKAVQAWRNGTWGAYVGVASRFDARENGIAGIRSYHPAQLTQSVLMGNGTSPDCGSTYHCADYLIEKWDYFGQAWVIYPCNQLPGGIAEGLRDTQCGTSFGCVDDQEQTYALGICELDP